MNYVNTPLSWKLNPSDIYPEFVRGRIYSDFRSISKRSYSLLFFFTSNCACRASRGGRWSEICSGYVHFNDDDDENNEDDDDNDDDDYDDDDDDNDDDDEFWSLFFEGVLTSEQYERLTNKSWGSSFQEQNRELLTNMMPAKLKSISACKIFMTALIKTDQRHIFNFIMNSTATGLE